MFYGVSNKKGNKGVYNSTIRTLSIYEERLRKIFDGLFNVLIPDCMDGYSVMSLLRKGHIVDGYEDNEVFLNGGNIDGFITNGLLSKVKNENLESKFKLYQKNFYKCKIEKQYNFVYCYRSLHLDRNKDIKMATKIRKLQSSVKADGYIYLFYYMANDEKNYELYPSNSYFRSYEMKSYFNSDNWNILYSIENHIRQHGPHIYDKTLHYHKIGILFAQKKNTRKKLRYKYTYNLF